MFFEKYECDIVSYADDSAPHICYSDLHTILSKFKNVQIVCLHGLRKIIWNQMVISVTSLSQLKNRFINIDGGNVKNKKEQKLLGIHFDSSLSFEGHITSLRKKAELHVLASSKLYRFC